MFENTKDIVQSVLGYIISLPVIRDIARLIVRLLRIPEPITRRIPIIGKFKFSLHGRDYQYISSRYDGVGRVVYWRGFSEYESETMLLLEKAMRKSSTFLDVGANVGIMSMAASTYNPNAIIYAFEPVPHIFNALQEHILINEMESNVHCLRSVVSNQLGEISFHVPHKNLSSGSLDLTGFANLPGSIISMPSITIDSFSESEGLQKIDLIKIDVEGFEVDVLSGAIKTMSRDKPVIICECLPGANADGIEELLKQYGYRYYHLLPDGPLLMDHIVPDLNNQYNNYLFITDEDHSRLYS